MTLDFNPAEVLRGAGYRATSGRVKLLKLLAKERRPLTVREIHEKLGRSELNQVTLYRALESLAASRVIGRVDLQHGHAHYELAGTHHHHIVCTDCGSVEDFSDTLCDDMIEHAARTSNSFETITSHAMELFGICARCS